MNTTDCQPCCTTTPPVAIPGVEGLPGDPGENGDDGAPGYAFPFVLDADTTIPPGDDNIKVNNATFGSITAIYVSDLDRNGICIYSTLNEIKNGDRLVIWQDSDHQFFSSFAVSGTPTSTGTPCDPGSFFSFPVTPNTSTGPTGDVHLAIGPSGFTAPLDLVNDEADGSGTDYSLTNAYANIAFGTNQIEVVLPITGTYLVQTILTVTAIAGDDLLFKYRNSTDASDIAGSEINVDRGDSQGLLQASLMSLITITAAPKTIQVWGVNSAAARGTVYSAYSKTIFVKVST